jgi:VWFA-related protein
MRRTATESLCSRSWLRLPAVEAALDEISDELHHQYSLGYYPENKNWDGKFRKVEISAAEKGYKVYARKGYYANQPPAKAAATTN